MSTHSFTWGGVSEDVMDPPCFDKGNSKGNIMSETDQEPMKLKKRRLLVLYNMYA